MSLRDDVFVYMKKKYKAEPEYLWRSYPDYAVFRHAENRKWFGIVMNVPERVLGLPGNEATDILNVKVDDPILLDLLLRQSGYFPGWHMNRRNWISIRLDGTVAFDEICGMIREA